jgi:hypothetical protein
LALRVLKKKKLGRKRKERKREAKQINPTMMNEPAVSVMATPLDSKEGKESKDRPMCEPVSVMASEIEITPSRSEIPVATALFAGAMPFDASSVAGALPAQASPRKRKRPKQGKPGYNAYTRKTFDKLSTGRNSGRSNRVNMLRETIIKLGGSKEGQIALLVHLFDQRAKGIFKEDILKALVTQTRLGKKAVQTVRFSVVFMQFSVSNPRSFPHLGCCGTL